MKKLLLLLVAAITVTNTSVAQTADSSKNKTTAMNYDAGVGMSFKDSYIRVKYGTNNIYKKFGAYAVYETKSSPKYSNIIVGANFFLNENWGAFAGIGFSDSRKELGISYRNEKFGGIDLGYSSSVGPTITYLYNFGKKK